MTTRSLIYAWEEARANGRSRAWEWQGWRVEYWPMLAIMSGMMNRELQPFELIRQDRIVGRFASWEEVEAAVTNNEARS